MVDEMFCVEQEDLKHMSTYICVICVDQENIGHTSFETFVLSMKLWNT